MHSIEFPIVKKRKKNKFDDFVFSTRLRISRNIDGIKFPNLLTEKEKKLLEDHIINIIKNNFNNIIVDSIDKLGRDKIILYINNKVLTTEFLRNSNTLIYDTNGEWIIYINEDDHLKLFSIEYGYNPKKIYNKLEQVIDKLENYIDFAFDENYGYFTSSVINVGTGLKVSCLINLYGLVATKKIESVIEAASKIGFLIQNISVDNQESPLFYVFNIYSLGVSELEILDEFESFLDKLYNLEFEARNEFFSKKEELEIVFEEIFELNTQEEIDWNNSLYYIALLDALNNKYVKIRDIEYLRKLIYYFDDNYLIHYYNVKPEDVDKKRLLLLRNIINSLKYIVRRKSFTKR